MIAKVQDIKSLLARGRLDPGAVFPALKGLAASEQWQTREVAATALVEIGKRHPEAVLRLARLWAKDKDSNVRRAASDGLRGIVKVDPESVRPIIEILRADPELYVKKSVANVLRNASGKHADFVRALCREWARSPNPHTQWIVKDGLRKLKASRPKDMEAILFTVSQHFTDRAASVRKTYDAILKVARALGPVDEDPKKTSIHLNRKTAFAGVATRRASLILTLKSAHDIKSSRIRKREQTSANRWHVEIELSAPAQIDGEIRSWLKSAYELAG